MKEPTVLIIEDNKMFRDLAFQVFEDTNRITAGDAEEGLKKFKENRPDITLLDIGLPGKSGLDILPAMVEYNPEAFIVMLTKSNLEKDVIQAKKMGATGYISKPFTLNKVAECMTLYKEHKRKLDAKSATERFHVESSKAFVEEMEKEHEKELVQQKEKEHEALIAKEIKKLSLLFVDDYPSNRYKAQHLFQKMGCKIDLAENGFQALDMVRKSAYNIILLDTHLGYDTDMDGYETAELIRIHERDNKLKKSTIIGMPEFSDEIQNNSWKQSGMDDYITKPAKVYKVKEILTKHIEEHLKEQK